MYDHFKERPSPDNDGNNHDIEFLPCPFCGSDELDGPHRADYIGDHYDPHYWIDCCHCPAEMNVKGETAENLAKAWNKRPEDEAKEAYYEATKGIGW